MVSVLIAVPVIWKYSILHLYYKIPTLVAILSLFGFIFCFILYVKGIIELINPAQIFNQLFGLQGLTFPDPGICDITKNPIFDYYWGVELYPHLGPFVSLKLLTISRFGLFLWGLLAMIAWKANYELYIASYNRGHVNWPITTITLLVIVYLGKFYYWEDGYMQVDNDMKINLDK